MTPGSLEKIEKLNVVVKLSERCNLACTYCYFFFHNDASYKQHPPIIKADTLDGLVGFLRGAIETYDIPHVVIVFHGGEPLLMKPKRFDQTCKALRTGLEDMCKLGFAVQTNGTLVNDDWVDVFEKWRVHVGISLDGPEELNDANRIDHKGRGSYRAVKAGIDKLRDAIADNRLPEIGLLCVANPQHSGKRNYRHFVDDLGFKHMNFLMLDVDHDTVTPDIVEGTKDYFLEIFEEWIADNDPNIRIRFFSESLACLLTDEAISQIGPRREDVTPMVTVSSNGMVGPEDVIKSLGGRFAEERFSVNGNHFRDVYESPIWTEFRKALTTKPAQCDGCRWFGFCRGGRMNHRYSKAEGFAHNSVFCDALDAIYGRIYEYVTENGLDADDVDARLGRFMDPPMPPIFREKDQALAPSEASL